MLLVLVYERGDEWKPFHFDAAAIDPEKGLKNMTVGVSFGAEEVFVFSMLKREQELSSVQMECVMLLVKNQYNWRLVYLQK